MMKEWEYGNYEYFVNLCFYCGKIINPQDYKYCSGCGKELKKVSATLVNKKQIAQKINGFKNGC